MKTSILKVMVHISFRADHLECVAVKFAGTSHFNLYKPQYDGKTFDYVTHIKTPGELFRQASPDEIKFLSEKHPRVMEA
jgi:hypothetical protein